jgi:hypothetical protein
MGRKATAQWWRDQRRRATAMERATRTRERREDAAQSKEALVTLRSY